MTFAKSFEEPPTVWGVGRLVIGDVVIPWPVSQADIADEAESMAPRLTALGLEPGGLVLIVSLLSQAIHVVPLEQAAGRVGALYSSADATPFDAFRTASLVRQLEPQVVLGVTGAVLDGLAELGRDPVEVFATVRSVVTADDDAYGRLATADGAPLPSIKLGPTSAFGDRNGEGLAYDPVRWRVEQSDGELVITSLAPRLTPAERLRTGVRGAVHDGRVLVGR